MDDYTDDEVFTYETADGVRHSPTAFEKMVVQSEPEIRMTRRVLVDGDKDTSYCFEAEWDGSRGSFTLYVAAKKKLTRCYKFDDPTGLASPKRKVDFRALRDTKTWAIVRRYLRKKGVSPSAPCQFRDDVDDRTETHALEETATTAPGSNNSTAGM